MKRNFSASLLFLSLLTACAHQLHSGNVTISENIVLGLLPPASFGQQLGFTQNAEIEFEGEHHQLIFYTEISDSSIVIVGTLPNGTRIFTISFDGESVVSDSLGNLNGMVDAQYFLADLQLAQWPLKTLLDSLALTSPCISSRDCLLLESETGLSRSLVSNGETVVSITYSETPHYRGETKVIHHQRGYEITLDTLDVYEL